MVKVEVCFLAQIAEESGVRKLVISTANTLPEAVSEIEKATGFPLASKLGSGYAILVNGRSYQLLQNEEIVLHDGDKIAIIQALGGG